MVCTVGFVPVSLRSISGDRYVSEFVLTNQLILCKSESGK